MTLLWGIGIVAFAIGSLALLWRWFAKAPFGFEDEHGWHAGHPPEDRGP